METPFYYTISNWEIGFKQLHYYCSIYNEQGKQIQCPQFEFKAGGTTKQEVRDTKEWRKVLHKAGLKELPTELYVILTKERSKQIQIKVLEDEQQRIQQRLIQIETELNILK